MSYKSLSQIKFMHSQHPKIAKRWDKKYNTPDNLPEKLSKRKSRKEK